MSIKSKITDEMKQALRQKDKQKLLALRGLLSEIKNYEIDHKDVTDMDIQQFVIARMIKQWEDALMDYKKAGRHDLENEALYRLKLLKSYMPEEVSEEKIKQIAEQIKNQNKDIKIGPLIGKVLAELKKQNPLVNGKKIAEVVKKMY